MWISTEHVQNWKRGTERETRYLGGTWCRSMRRLRNQEQTRTVHVGRREAPLEDAQPLSAQPGLPLPPGPGNSRQEAGVGETHRSIPSLFTPGEALLYVNITFTPAPLKSFESEEQNKSRVHDPSEGREPSEPSAPLASLQDADPRALPMLRSQQLPQPLEAPPLFVGVGGSLERWPVQWEPLWDFTISQAQRWLERLGEQGWAGRGGGGEDALSSLPLPVMSKQEATARSCHQRNPPAWRGARALGNVLLRN